jgi:hypothetical protein
MSAESLYEQLQQAGIKACPGMCNDWFGLTSSVENSS